MTDFRFCWVVAVKPEAQAVMDYFSLRRDENASSGGFPVYRNHDSGVVLTLSGPGKTNASAATAWLGAKIIGESRGPSAWINFGIAGAGNAGVGELFRAGKVVDWATGKSCFPQAVWPKKADLPVATVRTVDRPTGDYPEGNILIDMEASGFLPLARKFAGNELAQVFKVVSDTPQEPLHQIKGALVKDICRAALDRMKPTLKAMEALLAQESQRLADPPLFPEICDRWDFSTTNRHRLRRLLQLWGSTKSGGARTVDWFEAQRCRNGKDVIHALEKELWSDDPLHSRKGGIAEKMACPKDPKPCK